MKKNYALYYPTIEFQNPKWLWSAALFWDRIYRIQPTGYIGSESRNIQELMSDGTIGIPVDPSKYAEAVSEEFNKNNNGHIWDAAALDNFRYMSDKYVELHSDKVDVKLRKLMIGKVKEEFNSEWLKVPREIASLYMIYLADYIAKENNLSVITDDSAALIGSNYFSYNGGVDDLYYDCENVLASFTISNVIPINILDIPADKLLEFRNKRKDERKRFVDSIKNLSDNISMCTDSQVIKDIVNDHIIEVKDSMKEFKKSADMLRVVKWTGLKTLVFPALTPVINEFCSINEKQKFFLQSIGVSLGILAGLYEYKQDYNNRLKNYQYSYLLQLEKWYGNMSVFNGKYHQQLNDGMNQFIRD